MHSVQLFVEDEISEAYAILAAKAMGVDRLPPQAQNAPRIRAARVEVGELTDFDSLLDLTQRAHRSGFQQVIFVLDHEGYSADKGRVAARQAFERAFRRLCDHLQALPDDDPLKRMRVVRLEVHSCLEAWLLCDPQAIVAAVGGGSAVRPSQRQTHDLTPAEARERIAEIVRQAGRRRGRLHWQQYGGHAVKSLSRKIAPKLELERARHWNFSLDYFCAMIEGNEDGCIRPFPSSGVSLHA